MARILVVDDNADERRIYSAVLNHHGHEVVEAPNARAGVEAAKRSQPAVILMDVYLPDMNGLRASELLRAAPETASIPIVCVTGYDVTAVQARASGCSDFLRKPVTPAILISSVDALLPEDNPRASL